MRRLWWGGHEIERDVRELMRTQWLSKQELEAMQLKKIQQLIKYAYKNVPYYRNRYTKEGINPRDIKSLSDFQALPFVTKKDINNDLNAFLSSEYRGKVIKNKTGGSTGTPLRFFTDASSSRWGGAVRIRGRKWYGVREGEKVAWIWGVLRNKPHFDWSRRLKAGIKRERYLNVWSMTNEANMHSFAMKLIRWKPAVIRAYPSALYVFAKYIKEKGLLGISPRLIETTSEKMMDYQRQLIKTVFDCPIADCYSSLELYEMAYQCPKGSIHVCEPVYLEVIAGNQQAKPEGIGEVFVTSLTKFAMPFIRYKMDDMAIIGADDCPCGRKLPVLREIVGRNTDCLVTASGKFIVGSFINSIFWEKPEVVQFQVYQKSRKHLKVIMVCKKKVSSAFLDNIANELKAHLGNEIEIDLSVVDQIELTPAGKHRYVISEVNPDEYVLKK